MYKEIESLHVLGLVVKALSTMSLQPLAPPSYYPHCRGEGQQWETTQKTPSLRRVEKRASKDLFRASNTLIPSIFSPLNILLAFSICCMMFRSHIIIHSSVMTLTECCCIKFSYPAELSLQSANTFCVIILQQ